MHSKAKTIRPQAGKGKDLQAAFRFHTDIQAKDTFKPGEPIRLSVSVRANLQTQNASIKLFLPEIQALENKRAGQPAIIPVGKPLKPQSSWSRSFSKGQTFSEQKTVTVSQAGYYHVVVNVKARQGNELTKKGTPIINSAWKDIWVWIAPSEGMVTANFQRNLFKKNMRQQAGPFTKKTEKPNLQIIQNEHQNRSSYIAYQVSYLDYSDNMSYKYLKDAKVTYEGPSVSGSVQTNNQGIAYLPCSINDVTVYNKNDKVKISNAQNGETVGGTTGSLSSYCGGTYSFSSYVSYIFATMTDVIINSRSFFQHSRGPVVVFRKDSGVSVYHPGADYIEIVDSTNLGSDYSAFGMAHEYGHALQEKALGGIPNYVCSNSGHYVFGAYNLGCAYGEGFADYHADAVGFPYFNFKANPYVNNGEDGSIIEGAVAAFFWDLTDPNSESFDNADYPGSYVADIVKDCQVDGNDANGIDHLIACFQHEIPDYSNHFSTRSNIPSTYTENVTEPSGWNRTDIKKLWYKDLYGESYTPPPPPLNVSLSGSSSLLGNQQGSWTASVSGGNGSYSYSWRYRERCTGQCTWGSWNSLSESSSQLSHSFGNPQQESREVQLDVHVSSGAEDDSDYMTFNVFYQGGPGLRIPADSAENEPRTTVSSAGVLGNRNR